MKKLLHIIPYENLFPPTNGGSLRCFHLMHEFSRYFEVDVLIFQNKNDIFEKGYTNKNINFYNSDSFPSPKTIFNFLPQKIGNALKYRWLTKSNRSATKHLLEFSHIIEELSKRYIYEYVIFEHISTLDLRGVIKKHQKTAKLILDAHNVDHVLLKKEKEFGLKNIGDSIINNTKKLESNLFKTIDYVFTCSRNDLLSLKEINRGSLNGIVVPNGVDTTSKQFFITKENTNTLIFCGDLNTVANKNGLLWFFDNVWEKLKKQFGDINLFVVGKGDNHKDFDRLRSDSKIVFTGFVDDLSKIYKKASISIVPLNVGSGTRLKILESMSYGLPVVSTGIGAEGVDYPKGIIQIEDNPENFANAIISLLKNEDLYNNQRLLANKFVINNFDWQIIVENCVKTLRSYDQ